jgi:hypothetical protein
MMSDKRHPVIRKNSCGLRYQACVWRISNYHLNSKT